MADEWQDVGTNQNEWQDVSTPTPKPNVGDLALDTYARAGMGAYDAMKWIPGVKQMANIVPGPSADVMSNNLQKNANFGQKVVQGTGQAFATIPQVMPFVKGAEAIPMINRIAGGAFNPVAGMGAYGATKSAVQGENIGKGALEGAEQGAVYGAGGKIGTNIANAVAKPMMGVLNPIARNIVNRVGTSVGSAGAGAVMAPDSDKASSAMVGGALGAFSPTEPSNRITQEQLDSHTSKMGSIYRKILNPTAGEIRGLDKSGKTIDDAMNLAAQKGLIINKDSANKIDTSDARKIINDHTKELDDQLTNALKVNTAQQFDLKQIGKQAKADYRAKTNNDLEYEQGADHIDKQISAAIKNRGRFVDGADLNEVKRGMWQTSYNQGIPNGQDAARSVGYATKKAIENAYPNSDGIKNINQQMGANETLDNLLQKAHGRIVDKGKLGKYISQGFGGLTGLAVGHSVPIPGLREIAEVGGAKLGAMAGEKVNDWQNDPARITGNWANKLKEFEVTNPRQQTNYNQPQSGTAGNPQMIFPGQSGYINKPIGQLPNQTAGLLPTPKQAGYSPSEHKIIGQGAIIPPNVRGQKTVIPPNLNKPLGLSAPQVQNPLPQYLQERQNYPQQPIELGRPSIPYKPGPDAIITPKPQVMDFNPLKNPVTPQQNPLGQGVKALGMAGAIGLGAMTGNAQASQKIDMDKIYQIESSGNTNASNLHSGARGLGQITPIVLKDWNNMHPNDRHKSSELFDGDTNKKISNWYMNARIPQLLRSKGLQDTPTNRLVAYNAGITHVGKTFPKETQDYIKKYNQGVNNE